MNFNKLYDKAKKQAISISQQRRPKTVSPLGRAIAPFHQASFLRGVEFAYQELMEKKQCDKPLN